MNGEKKGKQSNQYCLSCLTKNHLTSLAFGTVGCQKGWNTVLSIITTQPNQIVKPVHDSPIILAEPEIQQMFDDPQELQAQLQPYSGEIEGYPVSMAVKYHIMISQGW